MGDMDRRGRGSHSTPQFRIVLPARSRARRAHTRVRVRGTRGNLRRQMGLSRGSVETGLYGMRIVVLRRACLERSFRVPHSFQEHIYLYILKGALDME